MQNVPITGRALLEADWDVKLQKERSKRRMEKAAAKKTKPQTKEMLKPKAEELTLSKSVSKKEELDHYFPASTPEVTTYLWIPLAPTPTSRVPLPPFPSSTSAHPLLPYSVIASLHNSHEMHSLRVSSLFARLDGARVFDDSSVRYEARGDLTGLCTVLEIRFEGWQKSRLRSVLGEAGTGWCDMEEVWRDEEMAENEEMDDALERMSDADVSLSGTEDTFRASEFSPVTATLGDRFDRDIGMPRIDIDPSTSFVLPTLDFSASFPIHSGVGVQRQEPSYDWNSPSPPTSPTLSSPGALSPYESVLGSPMSDLAFHNAWTALERRSSPTEADDDSMSDSFSDLGPLSLSSSAFESPNVSPPRRSSDGGLSESWVNFGFSSSFADRMGEVQEPREALF